MKDFFKVTDLPDVFSLIPGFPAVSLETVSVADGLGRVLAQDLASDEDLPDFMRATMDGYAVRASSTFGASEGNPAYLEVAGTIAMGESPGFGIGPGQCARISTGGMLPQGADAVVMIEHTEALDEAGKEAGEESGDQAGGEIGSTIEVYKSVAPGQHLLQAGEDIRKGETILSAGRRLRPQEIGLLAALGIEQIPVYRLPIVAILSTGDEVVPIDRSPKPGQIRDVNTYTLAGMVKEAGAVPLIFGIVPDEYEELLNTCKEALEKADMVLISGGSSVGTRDFTVEVFSALPHAGILVHGISISPGKPTILARVREKPVWGLPGHVTSAMVVFTVVVLPFLCHLSGEKVRQKPRITAKMARNISSAQGRVDFIRVRLVKRENTLWAEPVLGKSGLIHTMVKADGLVEIDRDTEGLDREAQVSVIPLSKL